jgi:hypothetical protein
VGDSVGDNDAVLVGRGRLVAVEEENGKGVRVSLSIARGTGLSRDNNPQINKKTQARATNPTTNFLINEFR